MTGRRHSDRDTVKVRKAKMHDLTRDEMEALVIERERQIALGYLHWLEQWVPNDEDGRH